MNHFYKYEFAIIVVLANLIALSTAQGGTFVDNFNDNIINNKYWEIAIGGVGPTVEETNQSLEVYIPSSSSHNGSNRIFGGLTGTYYLVGDFDIQVDFNLLIWPTPNGMGVGLGTPYVELQRGSFKPGVSNPYEFYSIDFFGGVATFEITTTDTLGKLRMKRTGNTVEGFYWKGNYWEVLGSYSDDLLSEPSDFVLIVFCNSVYLPSESVKAAFDNFKITNGQIITPTLSPLMLLLKD
jgi:hypothetical protein